jgi:hypothetical protein
LKSRRFDPFLTDDGQIGIRPIALMTYAGNDTIADERIREGCAADSHCMHQHSVSFSTSISIALIAENALHGLDIFQKYHKQVLLCGSQIDFWICSFANKAIKT